MTACWYCMPVNLIAWRQHRLNYIVCRDRVFTGGMYLNATGLFTPGHYALVSAFPVAHFSHSQRMLSTVNLPSGLWYNPMTYECWYFASLILLQQLTETAASKPNPDINRTVFNKQILIIVWPINISDGYYKANHNTSIVWYSTSVRWKLKYTR